MSRFCVNISLHSSDRNTQQGKLLDCMVIACLVSEEIAKLFPRVGNNLPLDFFRHHCNGRGMSSYCQVWMEVWPTHVVCTVSTVSRWSSGLSWWSPFLPWHQPSRMLSTSVQPGKSGSPWCWLGFCWSGRGGVTDFSVFFDWGRAIIPQSFLSSVLLWCPIFVFWLERAGFWTFLWSVLICISGLLAHSVSNSEYLSEMKTREPTAVSSLRYCGLCLHLTSWSSFHLSEFSYICLYIIFRVLSCTQNISKQHIHYILLAVRVFPGWGFNVHCIECKHQFCELISLC